MQAPRLFSLFALQYAFCVNLQLQSSPPSLPNSMSDQAITNGKLVSLTYSISDESGQVLEQSDLPVTYIHGGQNELIGGMDKAVAGKRAGDKVELKVNPDQGFGPHDPDLTFTDATDNVPPQFRHVGAEVQMQNESGEIKTFYVTKIENDQLTVDGNHRLAGKDLRVKVQIKEVRDPTEQELSRGRLDPRGALWSSLTTDRPDLRLFVQGANPHFPTESDSTMKLGVVVLAAGQGTRMHSRLPKVLHRLAGAPLLAHVLDTAHAIAAPGFVSFTAMPESSYDRPWPSTSAAGRSRPSNMGQDTRSCRRCRRCLIWIGC